MRHSGWRKLQGDTDRPDLLDLSKKMLGYLDNQRRLSGVTSMVLRRTLKDGSEVVARFVDGQPMVSIRAGGNQWLGEVTLRMFVTDYSAGGTTVYFRAFDLEAALLSEGRAKPRVLKTRRIDKQVAQFNYSSFISSAGGTYRDMHVQPGGLANMQETTTIIGYGGAGESTSRTDGFDADLAPIWQVSSRPTYDPSLLQESGGSAGATTCVMTSGRTVSLGPNEATIRVVSRAGVIESEEIVVTSPAGGASFCTEGDGRFSMARVDDEVYTINPQGQRKSLLVPAFGIGNISAGWCPLAGRVAMHVKNGSLDDFAVLEYTMGDDEHPVLGAELYRLSLPAGDTPDGMVMSWSGQYAAFNQLFRVVGMAPMTADVVVVDLRTGGIVLRIPSTVTVPFPELCFFSLDDKEIYTRHGDGIYRTELKAPNERRLVFAGNYGWVWPGIVKARQSMTARSD